jgi:hypothetical protein
MKALEHVWELGVLCGSWAPVEQASACLHLNFAALAKFKTKQAEACSTGSV